MSFFTLFSIQPKSKFSAKNGFLLNLTYIKILIYLLFKSYSKKGHLLQKIYIIYFVDENQNLFYSRLLKIDRV